MYVSERDANHDPVCVCVCGCVCLFGWVDMRCAGKDNCSNLSSPSHSPHCSDLQKLSPGLTLHARTSKHPHVYKSTGSSDQLYPKFPSQSSQMCKNKWMDTDVQHREAQTLEHSAQSGLLSIKEALVCQTHIHRLPSVYSHMQSFTPASSNAFRWEHKWKKRSCLIFKVVALKLYWLSMMYSIKTTRKCMKHIYWEYKYNILLFLQHFCTVYC